MKDYTVIPTINTPRIIFTKISDHTILVRIEGESYPENANVFYKEIKELMKEAREKGFDLDVTFDLKYFNSSTTIHILDIFEILGDSKYSSECKLVWFCLPDDEDGREAIEELLADFTFKKKIQTR